MSLGLRLADTIQHIPTSIKITAEASCFTIILGTIIGWLPDVAAGLSVFWLCLQIYGWFKGRKNV